MTANKSLFLSREVEVYVNWGNEWWQIPVLDGFSFSQTTNTVEVTVKEMADASNNSRRGRMMFNDSLSPAEWSFSTYARPFKMNDGNSISRHHAIEEVLWAMMTNAKADAYETGPNHWNDTTSLLNDTGPGFIVNFEDSNKLVNTVNPDIYFHFPENDNNQGTTGNSDLWYKVTDACVGEAAIDFDMDGITTINWSGNGTSLKEVAAPTGYDTQEITGGIRNSTASFIRNRLTQLTLNNSDGGDLQSSYSLVLTGGSITITNNVEYITPESLGVVNAPMGHVYGNRAVSGSFTCYLDHGSAASADLLEDLLSSTSKVKNNFNATFKVGGAAATPRVEFNCPQAHLEIPSHSVEDVISMEVSFHAVPSDIANTDEITIKYFGAS